ncbi:MAG: hypothetical protein ACRDNE_02930 [Gaiellaceae bacterium]
MTRFPILALTLVAAAVLTATARADGLPLVNVDVGATGVAAPAEDVRYVALPAGRDTLVARVAQAGGEVLESRLLPGRFTIPAVAYDGSAGGLSADGRTLVLISPRRSFPRAETAFAILDAERLRVREVVTLRGDFSFDAISQSGSWLYLVQYVSPRDPTRYLVRLYDLRSGRLLREPVIDPREVGDVMRGSPITRAASPDGRWAYTLYNGAGEHPFIHALDTSGRTAVCIDLHGLAGHPSLFDLRLDVSGDGGTIAVLDGGDPVALADTATFEVSEPTEPAAEAPNPTPEQEDGLPWLLVGAPAAALLIAAGFWLALRRRPGGVTLSDTLPEPFVLPDSRPLDGDGGSEDREREKVLVP